MGRLFLLKQKNRAVLLKTYRQGLSARQVRTDIINIYGASKSLKVSKVNKTYFAKKKGRVLKKGIRGSGLYLVKR